jgi:hypothetical protein
MFKVTKRSLTALTVLAIAVATSAAQASSGLNPSPRGVAIALGPSANSPSTVSPPSPAPFAGFAHCPRVGPCASPYSVVPHSSGKHSVNPLTASSQRPFEWGDAGIGAAAMLVLLSVVAVAAVVGTRRQRHRVTAS